MIHNLWQYRQFIYSSVKRDFMARYKGSVLGVLWAVFQPLSMILVYTVIFSQVMQNRLAGMEMLPYAYSIYLCAGTLPWNLFSEVLMGCTGVFFANANLMKKVSFPRICLPAITVCSALVNFAIGFALFVVFMGLIGHFPWRTFLAVIPLLGLEIVFTVTLGIGLAVMNVFFRDIGQIMGILLQFWFWFTPIVYPAQILPDWATSILSINPMYHLMAAFQGIFLYDRLPDLWGLLYVLVWSILLGIWAIRLYHHHAGELVDEL
ncbi:ABC transporter permease [Selenomonas sp.]|uniref:ABC transporter permease n=1 Tax=Selenomonas sp. TaxID=2053611 RepID=UPI0025D574FF|nr:ABC transporter permease [Selenomonas sp.]MCI6284975.1 ABC transporter permease [Selenomonas sp.]